MAKKSGLAGWSKWIIAFDSHGDQIDENAEKAFWEFCKYWKPTLRIHGGDWADLRPFRKGADADEKAEGIGDDVRAAIRFLHKLDPHVILIGNHDLRLWEVSENAINGVLRTYASGLIDDLYKKFPDAQWAEYDVTGWDYTIGKDLSVLHGFACGMYAAKAHALVYGNCVHGHGHWRSVQTVPRKNGVEVGHASGCLAKLNPKFATRRMNTLRWEHGWAYGLVNDRTGDWTCWLAHKAGDTWILPSEMRVM